MRTRLVGMPASPGIVVGPVHLLRWEVPDVPHRVVDDDEIPVELARLRDAIERAKDRLRQVRARAEKNAGPEEARIFDVQISILEDDSLTLDVEGRIHENLAAEHAFDQVMTERLRFFERHGSPMMRERVPDLTDVQIRVLTVLLGLPDHDPVDVPKGANAILVTHDLTPGLTMQLDREAIAAIATDAGTRTSHVAILARSLGMPAVVGLRNAAQVVLGGEQVILDGSTGVLVVAPSEEDLAHYRTRALREKEDEAALATLAEAEAVTTDGERVVLRANVDLPEEARLAAGSGAEGVGLMRTEFLVMGRAAMPDEEEQYRAYRGVVEAFGSRPVVIRTYDIGGDKMPIGGFPEEANPFLGWRAIRMCLDQPDTVFLPQLRAMLRAAAHGDVRIMLPLIVTLDEVREARVLLRRAEEQLRARGVPYRAGVPLGVMIETPAAAVTADMLAGEVDFFSIGTNDLVQYTLAVDRGNANLASRFTPLHPAVLRLIRRTVEMANAHRIDVAVCGEMASQPLMAFTLLGLGLRQLSVAPRSVPLVKRIVRGVSAAQARAAADAALATATAREAELEVKRHLLEALGDAPFLRDGLLDFAGGVNVSASG